LSSESSRRIHKSSLPSSPLRWHCGDPPARRVYGFEFPSPRGASTSRSPSAMALSRITQNQTRYSQGRPQIPSYWQTPSPRGPETVQVRTKTRVCREAYRGTPNPRPFPLILKAETTSQVTLNAWLPAGSSTLPLQASHYVGVGVAVLNDEGNLLVVQERNGPLKGRNFWKVPTGMVKPSTIRPRKCTIQTAFELQEHPLSAKF
jgi:hypothetical protein